MSQMPAALVVNEPRTVKHDIPVSFHLVMFKPIKKTGQLRRLKGAPQTIHKVIDVFALMSKHVGLTEIVYKPNANSRYEYYFRAIRINDGVIECTVNCDDGQAEDIDIHNKKKKKRKQVPLEEGDATTKCCHILIQPHDDGLTAHVLIEGHRGVSENVFRRLVNEVLERVETSQSSPDFFKENYAGGGLKEDGTPYEMEFTIQTKVQPVTDSDIAEKIESGDFVHVEVAQTSIHKVSEEAPELIEDKEIIRLKPYGLTKKFSIVSLFKGVKKIGASKFGTSKSTNISYKLCYVEDGHRRTIDINPDDSSINDLATKREWIAAFPRRTMSSDQLFDERLCGKIRYLFKALESECHDPDDR